ncbi:MAG: ribosome silencing factor [Planctomycetota bacterium]
MRPHLDTPLHSSIPPQEAPIEAKELAAAAAQIVDSKRAEDVEVIHVADQLKVADYFVVATGTSRAHVKALYDELHVRLKAAGHRHAPAEGGELGWWIVMDFGDVIVHLLQPQAREYYDLERLYADCPRLDWHGVKVELPETGSVQA